jgi:NAD(P)-dependent dehydrogenase (short-subunit alcohol dehydrogenase family)
MSLSGRVALVTGGSRGIGKSIALALAEDGADVAINYRRDDASASETVAEIEALGRKARAYGAAVDDFDALSAMVAGTEKELGPIDILINNAGIASRGLPLVDTEAAEIERCVRVHAFGPAQLCKLVLPGMRTRPRGDIVMISSVATLHWGPNSAPYNMGKAAMEALAFGLAKEEKRNGIHVNVVAPGLVETEMGRRLVKGAMGVDDIKSLNETSPFGRVCQPEDIANVVRFVVSDGGAYMTGEKLNVHGGGS